MMENLAGIQGITEVWELIPENNACGTLKDKDLFLLLVPLNTESLYSSLPRVKDSRFPSFGLGLI